MTEPSRPVLRYFGGKWMLAPWIISFFPPHRVYVEAYCGAASVLLRKPRCYSEVINDIDGLVVNMFRVLRNPTQARELVRQLELTPFSRQEYEESYLLDGDPIEQARRVIMRSFMGHGTDAIYQKSGFRGNVFRTGSTPAQDWARYPQALEEIVRRLQGVTVENLPALEVMRKNDSPETLHYIDPPYVHQTRGRDSRYRYEMTDQDHIDLAQAVRKLKGMAVVSGYPSPLYAELYKGWRMETKQAHADGALDRTEALWLKPGMAMQGSLLGGF